MFNSFEPMTPAPTRTSLVGLLLTNYKKLFFSIAFVLPILSMQAQTKEGKIYVQIENDAVAPFSIGSPTITEETHCTAPFNGAIQFPLSGGSGLYTLHWTGPNGFTLTASASSGTYTLSNLQDGDYDVVIEDGAGCEINESFSVPRNNLICYTGPGCSLGIGSYFSNSAHGCGGSLGEIHFIAYGANINPDFSYTVSGPNTYSNSGTGTDTDLDGQISIDLYNLQKGTYHVTVNFNNSCPTSSSTQAFDVEVKPWHFVDGAYPSSDVSDCLNANGAIFIGTLADVSTNMSYELTGPTGTQTLSPTTQTVSSLVVGTYTLTITDNDNGCYQTETFEIVMSSSPSLAINIDETINNAHCEAPYTGKIAVSASGGTGSYEYNWTDGSGNPVSSSATIDDVNGDYYSVSVRDFISGCSVSQTIFIDTENLLEDYTDIDGGFPTANTNCSAPYTGAVNITVTSGSPGPFNYTFYPALNLHSSVDESNPLLPVTTPFTQSNTTGLAPGAYYIEVKDLTTGCTGFFRDPDFGPIAMGIPDASTPSLNVTVDNLINNTVCGTPHDGVAAVTITSGSAYTILWKNLDDLTTYSVEDPTTLSPGLYELSVSISCSIGPNQAPVLSSSSPSINTNSNTATIINNTIGVTDVDDVNMEGATVSIGTGFVAAEDQLVFTNQNNISGNYNASSGVLTLTGSDTKAHYQTALRSVRYRSIAIPTFQSRTISFSVTDGQATSNTINVTVTINNQAPFIAGIGSAVNFMTGGGAIAISNSLTVSDPDNTNLQSAEVHITPGTFINGEDVLLFTNQNGIVGNYNAASGILTLSGSSSVANYQSALRSVQYNNSQASPNPQNRTIQFTVNDGTSNSTAATKNVSINSTNQLPIVATSGGTTTFLASSGGVIIDNGVTVTDADDTNLENATIQISSASFISGEDVLLFTDQNGITGSYDASTGILSLTGNASVSNYQTALQTIQYNNSETAPNPQDRIIEFQVNDGSGNSSLATKTVSISVPNQLPVVTTTTGSSSFVSSSGGTVIDNGITVTDTDDTDLESAVVQFSAASFVAGEDELLFSTQNGINGSYNTTTGTLSLTGSASLADYQTALRSVQYNSTATIPNTQNRAIEFSVNDGTDNSIIATKTITVILNQSPIVTTSPGSASFLSSSGGVVIDQVLIITDSDNSQLQSASVKINSTTLIASQDLLLFNNQSGITGSYNTTAGELILTGASSLANYQTALRSVQYNNSATTPNLQNRVIEFIVNDGTSNSALASRTIQLLLSNQPPVISDKPHVTQIASIASIDLADLISDPDGNIDLSTLKITKQPTSGAPASITSTFQLEVNYSGSRFAGMDKLSVEVCDKLAACAEHEFSISVEGDIAIYNGFSPNGDQSNPFFRIQNIETLEPKNNVSIFNRWGDAVFEIADYNNDSNKFIGENKNGNPLPSGTYFYKIEFPSGRKTLTGYLTLKR